MVSNAYHQTQFSRCVFENDAYIRKVYPRCDNEYHFNWIENPTLDGVNFTLSRVNNLHYVNLTAVRDDQGVITQFDFVKDDKFEKAGNINNSDIGYVKLGYKADGSLDYYQIWTDERERYFAKSRFTWKMKGYE